MKSVPSDIHDWDWDYLHESKLAADEIEAGLNDGTMYVGGIDQDGQRWIRKRLGRRPEHKRPPIRTEIRAAQAPMDVFSAFQHVLKAAPFNAECHATSDDFDCDAEIDGDVLAMTDSELELEGDDD